MSDVYWKMRNGKLINVDDMDNNHVRNAFKMLLRNRQKMKKQSHHFTLNGDMANEFNETYYADINDVEYDDDMYYSNADYYS